LIQSETVSKKRIAVILFIVLILMAGLIFRVIYLQIFMAGWLKKSAEEQRFRALPVLPRRGTIYDRIGNELAISIDADCIYAIPSEIDDPVKTATVLGRILSMDPLKIKGLITKRAAFVWIKRRASFDEIKQLRETNQRHQLSGIEISQKPQRFYPQTFLAAQVLGIAGIDNQGLEGVEKQFDLYLRGIPGSDQAEFDTAGHHIPQGERRYLAPVDGDSIYLTIDQNIQYIMERELDQAFVETKSKRAMGVAVDPQTGEILALACRPKYDPNQFGDYPAANRRNPIFSDMYEPGSTFKIFTTVAAFEEGKVSKDSTFFDPGFIIVDDRRIKCWKPGGHGSQNFVTALENSCNPVFASLALRITKETFYKYIRAFGFGSLTGVDFPGESGGTLKPLAQVKNVELATIGFGQGLTVTPIQMVMGVSAIANGGYLLNPLIVREVYSPENKLQKKFHRQVVRQVISGKTSSLMADLLKSVVTNGGGKRAFLEGYRVAGKTGTAQKVIQGQRGYRQLIASFIGFAPADKPRIVAMVIMDEPNCPITYGSVIAAPVVGNIFRDSLRYLGVKPKFEPEVLEKISSEEVIVPNLLYQPLEEAIKLLKKDQINYRLMGQGDFVFDQMPRPGVKINRNSKILLYFDPEEKYLLQGEKALVPNFSGFSLRKVDQIVKEIGLKLEAAGTGMAVSQDPPPGTMVEYGSRIQVFFKPNPE
jgi:stage V sporulation protein D (sporulation-specific penicillin-binding protein)